MIDRERAARNRRRARRHGWLAAVIVRVAEAGHFPQIEQPAAVLRAIRDFADNVVKPVS